MLQHQMVHSPARLGLPNPNSPSLIQQNQQQQQPPTALTNSTPPTSSASSSKLLVPNAAPSSSSSAASQSSSSSTASNALLPLLPPLARAQSLLAQMASLASRLFEVSPNRSLWLSSFRGTPPTFLSTAASASASGGGGGSSTKEILAQFTVLQTQLFEAVAQLQEILDLQDSTAKIAREVRSKDSATLAFSRRLSEAERLLDSLLDDYSHYQKRFKPNPKPNPNEEEEEEEEEEEDEDVSSSAAATATTTTVASRLQLPDILSYAHRISYTTFAPPEFGAGQAPLRGALPPAPQEEQMRASQLYAMANLDVGLPPIDTAGGFEPMMEPPPPPPPMATAEAGVPDFGMLPQNITVPVGWKPGMPVELPTNIPLPPPGWKPGDPVPLPPMPSLRDQSLHPKGAAETIQVRHVQLDILDQDDDSSDYSSDDASSDDDD